jgi:hypothetical protein
MQKSRIRLNCFPVLAELHAPRALSQDGTIAYAGRHKPPKTAALKTL